MPGIAVRSLSIHDSVDSACSGTLCPPWNKWQCKKWNERCNLTSDDDSDYITLYYLFRVLLPKLLPKSQKMYAFVNFSPYVILVGESLK